MKLLYIENECPAAHWLQVECCTWQDRCDIVVYNSRDSTRILCNVGHTVCTVYALFPCKIRFLTVQCSVEKAV